MKLVNEKIRFSFDINADEEGNYLAAVFLEPLLWSKYLSYYPASIAAIQSGYAVSVIPLIPLVPLKTK